MSLLRIYTNIQNIGINKVVEKAYQRNLQGIKTTSAYINDKLYYRKWKISEGNHIKEISQAYNAGHPIKNSKSKIDYYI